MEIKKSKITESKFPFTKQEGVDDFGMPKQVPEKDDYGNVTLSITLENGDNGLLKAQKNFERFKVGEELEYTIEEKESKAGKKYNMLRLPKKDGGYSGGGGSKYQPKKKIAYKADMVSFGFSYAKDMAIADKLPEDSKMGEMAVLLVKSMWKLLDEIEGLE
jgi:hypothetical protein